MEAGPPSIPVCLDTRDIQTGEDWDEAIARALIACDSLLFIITRDSAENESMCKHEWTHPLKYKKPVIPIKLHSDAEMTFRLVPRQHIDFTHTLDSDITFNMTLARLRRHLDWMLRRRVHFKR